MPGEQFQYVHNFDQKSILSLTVNDLHILLYLFSPFLWNYAQSKT